MKEFYILNTRNGENPNVLGASYINGSFTPVLASSGNGRPPSSLVAALWTITQVSAGLYCLKIKDPNNNSYILCLDEAGKDSPCILKPDTQENIINKYAAWSFPYPGQPRILLSAPQASNIMLSLDAGSYPTVIVWNFNSNVNQTWQFSFNSQPFAPFDPAFL